MKNSAFLFIVFILPASFSAQESINASGGESTGPGHASYSIGQVSYTAISSVSDDAILLQGVQIPYEFYSNDDCLVFQSPPVDLTKSFDPVNGVKDRIQLKWYKDSPEIRYTDEDAAMCDLKFWKKRFLDPATGNPTGPAIQDPDTILINNVKKKYPDNSPREIFKWPVKYRADGVNNSKRVEPNFRYEWQVRCECGHEGNGPESPWSVVRLFNTKDFDPVTGIYTPPSGQAEQELTKTLSVDVLDIQLYPNPNDGNFRMVFDAEVQLDEILLTLRDIQGKVIEQRSVQLGKANSDILWDSPLGLEKGVYLMEISTDRDRFTKRVIIDR